MANQLSERAGRYPDLGSIIPKGSLERHKDNMHFKKNRILGIGPLEETNYPVDGRYGIEPDIGIAGFGVPRKKRESGHIGMFNEYGGFGLSDTTRLGSLQFESIETIKNIEPDKRIDIELIHALLGNRENNVSKPVMNRDNGCAKDFKTEARKMCGRNNKKLEIALAGLCQYREGVGQFMSRFAKKGKESDALDLEGYTIEGDAAPYGVGFGLRHGDMDANKGWYDCSHAFCLLYHGKALAQVSFEAIHGGIIIKQIQARERIEGIKWERALVAYVERFAREHGIGTVSIQAAKNNTWDKIKNSSQPGQHGYMIYDVTAKRSGYSGDPRSGDYIKTIGTAKPETAPTNTSMGLPKYPIGIPEYIF